jgi:hypothetical protein
MKDDWLKLDAGSEYDAQWQRFFSIDEEERVTKIAEDLASEAQSLPSAQSWRAASDIKSAWIVLVLVKGANRMLRGLNLDNQGRRYAETCLTWDKHQEKSDAELRSVILDRVDQVFRALLAKDHVPKKE